MRTLSRPRWISIRSRKEMRSCLNQIYIYFKRMRVRSEEQKEKEEQEGGRRRRGIQGIGKKPQAMPF